MHREVFQKLICYPPVTDIRKDTRLCCLFSLLILMPLLLISFCWDSRTEGSKKLKWALHVYWNLCWHNYIFLIQTPFFVQLKQKENIKLTKYEQMKKKNKKTIKHQINMSLWPSLKWEVCSERPGSPVKQTIWCWTLTLSCCRFVNEISFPYHYHKAQSAFCVRCNTDTWQVSL